MHFNEQFVAISFESLSLKMIVVKVYGFLPDPTK
jgi:hypothetical protein